MVVDFIPLVQDFGGSPFDPIGKVASYGRRREFGSTFWLDTELRQSFKDGLHCEVGIPEELASADSYEPPTDSLKDRLSRHVVRDILDRMKAVTIAFNCEPPATTFYDEVDSVMAHNPLRFDAEPGTEQSLQNAPLEL